MSCGLTRNACFSSAAAPANSDEHQRAAEVAAGGDVLLGHQVHAVAVRGHEHDVGGPVQRGQLLARHRLVEVVHGGADHRAEDAVDVADLLLDRLAHVHVVLDALAAGRGHLHEHGVGRLDRAVLEQFLERVPAGRRCPWCSPAGRRPG